MKPDIFLSHSNAREDKALIDELEKLCDLAGLQLYVAERNPEYEKKISDKVKRGIDDSRCLLVLMTQGASTSQFVGNEVGYAESKVPVIVILEEGTQLKGFAHGLEPVKLLRENPSDALMKATKYIKEKILSGEFRSPESPVELAQKRKELVLQEAQLRLQPLIEKRFASLVEVSLEHELKVISGVTFVSCRTRFKQDLESSNSGEAWKFVALVEPTVLRKLAQLNAREKPYRFHKVEVRGIPLAPTVEEQFGMRVEKYECDLPPGPGLSIEVDCSNLSLPEDRFFFQLNRFARHVKLMYRKHDQLDYTAFETGGGVPVQAESPGPFKDVAVVERKGLVFPGWGYVISWSQMQS